ncbi:MAG: hypothetical protein CVV44_00520 [Spirochaetae bacterium HGW-Spirochaetae-1]|jgi:hypothetical protein|nr:MAG: hypothetical protein CVV44_00520 [Spirochaetae bacterium HGW-Spirochaetae-1]
MWKRPYTVLLTLSIGAVVFALTYAYTENKGFKTQLEDYIERHAIAETAESAEIKNDEDNTYSSTVIILPPISMGTDYREGDWDRYIVAPGYRSMEDRQGVTTLYRGADTEFISYGSMKLNLAYGGSVFANDKYRLSDQDRATSSLVQSGFMPEQEMQLHMEGKIGDRMTVYIDHDSQKQDNHYLMQYRAVKDDEVIREINAGEIDIKFNASKYAVYDNNTSKGLGVDITLRKKNLQVKAFGSISRGETTVETFRGNSSSGSTHLAEYQYVKRMYYQVEPYIRYDGAGNVPSFPGAYTSFNTFTSDQASFTPHAVNLEPSGFEVYLDDQNPNNNSDAIQLSIDQGYYSRLRDGVDYTVNYTTGLIKFLRDIPESGRIFVLYNLKGGSSASTDPAALYNTVYPGRFFVFIKYGAIINEDADRNGAIDGDRNGDGVMNLDVYEVRSFYYLGDRQLLSSDFSLQFYRENSIMTKTDISALGAYIIDYTTGTISFSHREPFRSLIDSASLDDIYTEKQPAGVATVSRYAMLADYYREARTFQLKNFNIIPGSVQVKVNDRVLAESLYSLDYTTGYLMFTDQNNPQISSETAIEVRYEYLPLGGQSQDFIGGVRADYEFNRNLSFGGSILLNRSSGSEIIPQLGAESSQTFLFEGDTTLKLDGRRIAEAVNIFTEKKRDYVPVEITGYAEIARSYRDVNTFGKGLLDNMESSNEITTISLSEKDWVLSSMPGGTLQADRGLLYYYYYQDPFNPGSLKGTSYNATAVAYAVKPGPYNVATGHVADSIEDTSAQRSLVFDYEFTGGTTCVSVASRQFSGGAVDFSGLQYVEISYRFEGTNDVNLFLDLGKINEDSDGDGILDTEDTNLNGYLDVDPDSNLTEDDGYPFNGNYSTVVGSGPGLSSYIRGDGVLNTEDLNRNGSLDTGENVITLPGADTSPASLTISAIDTSWKRARIYMNTSLTTAQIELLKEIWTVRLYMKGNAGESGKLFIDDIRFVSSRWKDPRINGVTASPANLQITTVNSINDSDYRANAFIFEQSGVYKSLYGEKTADELARETESAMQVWYNGTSGDEFSMERRLSSPVDLRFYRTLNLWQYCFQSGDEMSVIIGSSDTDYREYRYTMDFPNVWRETKLKLQEDSSGDVEIFSQTGDPDMKRINFIKIIVRSGNAAGKIWINDIYASQPETQKSNAHWVESDIKIKRPLFKTEKGTPVFSDIDVKFVQKGHGSQFSSVGKAGTDMSEQYYEIYSSMNVLPRWKTMFDFIREDSVTDSLNEDVSETKRGETVRNSFYVMSDYVSDTSGIPSIQLSCKSDFYDNMRDESALSNDISRRTGKISHTPTILINEKIENFLSGILTTRLLMNMLFKEEKLDRMSGTLDSASLSLIVPLEESEKSQRVDTSVEMSYSNKVFFIRPVFTMASEEIVEYTGKSSYNDSSLLGDLRGDFHFPFILSDDARLVERNKGLNCSLGITDYGYISPVYSMEMYYRENSFRDYNDSELTTSGSFVRAKDARSSAISRIDVPVNLNKISTVKKAGFIKGLNASFARSVYFSETAIPYEGEGYDAFDEQYGLKRSSSGILNEGLNVIQFFPGYFFLGRKTASKGRDYVYKTLNSSIDYATGTTVADYNNGLKIIENFSLNLLFDFSLFTADTGAGLNQICERQNIYGIPQQIITRTFNTRFSFDLMKIFDFWFFRPNSQDQPYHAAFFELGYSLNNSMIITGNLYENTHTPSIGITFKWDRSHLGIITGVDIRSKKYHEFISAESTADAIYYDAITINPGFSEVDTGYTFSVVYETDVKWIYDAFSKVYALVAFPIFTIEYSMKLNRYDYSLTAIPEPYDMHLLQGKLTMDLHRNVQGGMTGKMALENYRSRETGEVIRSIISYEVAAQMTLLF